MRIAIRHETRYDYEEPISGAVLRLRLTPPNTSAQTVVKWDVSVNDAPVERWISTGYGDSEALWRSADKLREIVIVAQGQVETSDTAGVTKRLHGAVRPLLFLRDTPLTEPSDKLRELAAANSSDNGPLDSMHRLVLAVHEAIRFKPGSTSFETTAAEALELGTGVCQDQTHVFITAARLMGIPSRYVTGYLKDPDRPDSEHEPHAWAEGWVQELGWVAFDCSLGNCPVEGHVRLTVGLDAQDAAPVRAVVSHGGEATLSSDVQMTAVPLDGSSQSQIQQQ